MRRGSLSPKVSIPPCAEDSFSPKVGIPPCAEASLSKVNLSLCAEASP